MSIAVLGSMGSGATKGIALASCFKRQDRLRDFSQIIVELMIALRQTMDASLRNGARVALEMRRWRDFVLKPVIEMDGNAFRKARPKIRRELQVVAWPSTIADKRRRDQEDRAELPGRCMLRQHFDENRSTDRMTDENRVIF